MHCYNPFNLIRVILHKNDHFAINFNVKLRSCRDKSSDNCIPWCTLHINMWDFCDCKHEIMTAVAQKKERRIFPPSTLPPPRHLIAICDIIIFHFEYVTFLFLNWFLKVAARTTLPRARWTSKQKSEWEKGQKKWKFCVCTWAISMHQ